MNIILSQIIRGEWLLPAEMLEKYLTLGVALLEGKDFQNGNKEPKAILSYIDSNGSQLQVRSHNVPEGSIAIVRMRGEVIKNGDQCVYGADEIVKALNLAENNPNVIGTILEIDGPGGAVNAINPFIQFAKTKKKPLVVLADMALSLHYWTAVVLADYLIADNNISARFGSVGVVLSFVDNRKYLEEKGYKIHEIYPEESNHKNEVVKLIREGNYDLVKKEHLSPIARKFQQYVRDNRPNLIEESGVLTGKTFGADEALRLGMIDKIGTLQTAILQVVALNAIRQV